MDTKKLNELRGSLVDEHEALIAGADTAERDLKDEENTRLDEIRSEIEKTDKKIADGIYITAQREKQSALNEQFSQSSEQRHYHVGSETPKFSDGEEKDLRNYSFFKLIREGARGQLTGLEKEMHEQAVSEARQNGTSIENWGVPRFLVNGERRAQTVGTNSEGGFTVQTSINDFIPALRKKLVLVEAGAQFLEGLTSSVAIPRIATATSPGMSAENATASEEEVVVEQVTLSPKRCAGFTKVSKQLIQQRSLDVESLITNDLTTQIASLIQDQAINGSGSSNQATGLLSVSGTNSVAGGTNGLAPTLDHAIDLESGVANANADIANLAYITNPSVRGKLKKTATDSGSGVFVMGNDNGLNGYPCFVSTAVPSNLTKGTASAVCSAIIFGDWSNLLIGSFGGLDILVDPYSAATEGIVQIVANSFIDVAVRHPAGFSIMADALTA